MKIPNVIRKSFVAGLVGAMFLVTMPSYAGKLATPMLPVFGSIQIDWTYTALVTNLGTHTETYELTCFTNDGSPVFPGTMSIDIEPGATMSRSYFTVPTQNIRCELDVNGSANNWRLLLCNYDYKNGLDYFGNQCIEGR